MKCSIFLRLFAPTDRQTDTHRHTDTDTDTDTHADTDTQRQRDRETERQRDRHRHTDNINRQHTDRPCAASVPGFVQRGDSNVRNAHR
eukprot:1544491-Rhodomonas_salina.2